MANNKIESMNKHSGRMLKENNEYINIADKIEDIHADIDLIQSNIETINSNMQQRVDAVRLSIAKGEVEGAKCVRKFGFNGDIDTDLETIWESGGLYPWQSTALNMTLASTEADDDGNTITLYGLDADYLEIEEDMVLNSAEPPVSTKAFLRLNRMINKGPDALTGVVTAVNAGTTYAEIDNGNNQTLMATYTVPAGKTAYVEEISANVGAGKDVTVYYYARPFGEVFQVKRVRRLYENSIFETFRCPYRFEEKTDLEVRAVGVSVNNKIAAAFGLLLFDNE